ncbi:hypothetical protein PM082_004270 [Marasmius tenuissimus]|nr:hypothetical protein PM082_004270 [Marasmius tenuissimus]
MAQPMLVDSGCVALSHNEDWMSVMNNFNAPELPTEANLLRCICGVFKFVMEEDVIQVERMNASELETISRSLDPSCNKLTLTPMLFVVRGQNEVIASELKGHTSKSLLRLPSRSHYIASRSKQVQPKGPRSATGCTVSNGRAKPKRPKSTGHTGKKKLTPFNKFIKEELHRLKESEPDLNHQDRFKLATANWKVAPENPNCEKF